MGPRYESSGNLQHRPSTKQLINRYESISYATGDGTPKRTPRTPTKNAAIGVKQEKSPLRQSFQNIVTAFKRRARAISSRHEESTHQLLTRPSCRPPTPPPKGRGCSGKLLYLSAGTSTSPVLAWKPYTATLGVDSICLDSLQTSGDSNSQLVSLIQCIDVRASVHDPSDPASPEPPIMKDIRPFELIFQGKAAQKFACFNAQDRAIWIDAIWDAIISLHDATKRSSLYTLNHEHNAIVQHHHLADSRCDRAIPKAPSPRGKDLPPPPTSSINRPPVQQLASNVDIGRLLPPLVITNGCPSLSTSSCTASTQSQFRPKSPSIANLDSLSVVKQRLAQIENVSPKPRKLAEQTAVTTLHTPRRLKFTPEISSHLNLLPESLHSSLSPSEDNDFVLDYYGGRERVQDWCDEGLIVTSELVEQEATPSTIQMAELPRGQRHDHAHGAPTELVCPAQDLPLSRVQDPIHSNSISGSNNQLSGAIDQQLAVQGTLLEGLSGKISDLERLVKLEDNSEAILLSLRDISLQLESCSRQHSAQLDRILAAKPLVAAPVQSSSGPSDSALIVSKLNELLAAQREETTKEKKRVEESTRHPHVEQLVGLLHADLNNRVSQHETQADSVRYLNELNAWLEAFVSNGTSQIQGLAANVEKLCHIMESGPNEARGDSVRADIQQLLMEGRSRENAIAALHNNLITMVHEQKQGSMVFPADLVAGIMAQQRREHESMLASVVQVISGEIRGERLRFVEAMKEATEINVQMHVDQFKCELHKEVITMTNEVQRLHIEKQAIENQLAQLFSLHSKQTLARDVRTR